MVVVAVDHTQLLKMVFQVDLVEDLLGLVVLLVQQPELHQVLQILLPQIADGATRVVLLILVLTQVKVVLAEVVQELLDPIGLVLVLAVLVVVDNRSQFLDLL
jgi:hypothetical protein